MHANSIHSGIRVTRFNCLDRIHLGLHLPQARRHQTSSGVKKSRERRKVGVKCSGATLRPLEWGSFDHLDPTVSERLIYSQLCKYRARLQHACTTQV